MGINGISDYANLIRDYRIPAVRFAESEEISERSGLREETGTTAIEAQEASSGVRERRNANLEDISIVFNRQDEFGYIGKDSDIRSLDVEKAISDMKKDSVLQQYQYFVGSFRELSSESPDGTVIQKF